MISPETLRFYPLFAHQDAEMLRQIAMLADEKHVETDHTLFFEGEVANQLFLIVDGSVVLTMNMGHRGEQNIEELEPLGKGELIGWSSIVPPHLYKMGAYADQDSQLVAFNAEKLRALLDANPVFGYHFVQKIAEVIGARLISKCVQLMSIAV